MSSGRVGFFFLCKGDSQGICQTGVTVEARFEGVFYLILVLMRLSLKPVMRREGDVQAADMVDRAYQ